MQCRVCAITTLGRAEDPVGTAILCGRTPLGREPLAVMAELGLGAGTVELQAPHAARTAVGTQRVLRKASQRGSVWVWMEPWGLGRQQH